MKKRILLVGSVQGAYRTQNLIHMLTDYIPNNGYEISFVNPDFYFDLGLNNNLLDKVKRKIKYYIQNILTTLDLLLKYFFSDIVYVVAMNHTWFRLCYRLKKIHDKPIMVDMYMSAYQAALDKGYLTKKNETYYKKTDKLMIEKSTKIIYPLKLELEYIAKSVGAIVNYNNVAIIPLAVEAKKISKPIKSKIFRVCWWGTWIPLHGIHNIILGIKIVKDIGIENIHLDLLGIESCEINKYTKMILDNGLDEFITVSTDKNFSDGTLEDYLSEECDLALGHFGETEKAEWVFTNKVIDAFSMKIPVLTMRNKVVYEIVEDKDLFLCENNPNSIAESLIYIMNNECERMDKAQNGYDKYVEKFSIKAYRRSVMSTIKSVFNDE